jgi:hypothetical protein
MEDYKKVKSFIERTNTPFMLNSQISIINNLKKKTSILLFSNNNIAKTIQ